MLSLGFNPDLCQYASSVPCPCRLTVVCEISPPLNMARYDIACVESSINRLFIRIVKLGDLLSSASLYQEYIISCVESSINRLFIRIVKLGDLLSSASLYQEYIIL